MFSYCRCEEKKYLTAKLLPKKAARILRNSLELTYQKLHSYLNDLQRYNSNKDMNIDKDFQLKRKEVSIFKIIHPQKFSFRRDFIFPHSFFYRAMLFSFFVIYSFYSKFLSLKYKKPFYVLWCTFWEVIATFCCLLSKHQLWAPPIQTRYLIYKVSYLSFSP